MIVLWLLLLFVLPALAVWSPVFAFAYWRTSGGSLRRYTWLWAWVLPASATVAILGWTGFIRDVFGSVQLTAAMSAFAPLAVGSSRCNPIDVPSIVPLLALGAGVFFWALITALRTGRADGLAFAALETRAKQPGVFWTYTVLMGIFCLGSLCIIFYVSTHC